MAGEQQQERLWVRCIQRTKEMNLCCRAELKKIAMAAALKMGPVRRPIASTEKGRQQHRQCQYLQQPEQYRDVVNLSQYLLVVDHALTQYSLKQGLKKFQEKAERAVHDEFMQLHDRNMFEPKMSDELTSEEKRKALPSLMFIKETQDRKIKGRTCADGVLISSVIDMHKGRKVVTTDIPGAYLNTNMEDDVYDLMARLT
eukprot:5255105-Ditylum_brightwellii.AAC.1